MKRRIGTGAERALESLRTDLAHRVVATAEVALLVTGCAVLFSRVDDTNTRSPYSTANLHRADRVRGCLLGLMQATDGSQQGADLNPILPDAQTASGDCNLGYSSAEERMLRDPFSAASIALLETVSTAVSYGTCAINPGGDRCLDLVGGGQEGGERWSYPPQAQAAQEHVVRQQG